MTDYVMHPAALITFVFFIALALVDLGLFVFRGTKGTISAFLISTGQKSIMTVFMLGAIAGHLFWYMDDPNCAGHLMSGITWNRYTLTQIGLSLVFYEGTRQIVVPLWRLARRIVGSLV